MSTARHVRLPVQMTFGESIGLKREAALELELKAAGERFDVLQRQFEDIKTLYRNIQRENHDLRNKYEPQTL